MTISRTLRHFLQEQHADYEVIPHESTHSAMQSALASSVPADQVAKAVLLDTEDGYLLAVLPANHRIMLSDLTAEFGRRPNWWRRTGWASYSTTATEARSRRLLPVMTFRSEERRVGKEWVSKGK